MRLPLLLSTLLFLFITACGQKKKESTTFIKPVKVVEAKSLDYVNYSFPGIVESKQSVNLAFKVSGQLIDIAVKEGESITKGQLVAVIDSKDYQLSLDAAEAAYIKSESQLKRYQQLIKSGAISQQELETSEALYKRDRSSYESAQSTLDDTKLYAPFAGVVQERYVDNFQRVQPAQTIITLVNPSELDMKFTLSESLLHIINAPDKSIYVTFEPFPNVKFKGVADKIVDTSIGGGGYPVTVEIDDKEFNLEKYDIKIGFSCTIFIDVYNSDYRNMVSVPMSAVSESLSSTQKYVWVYDKDGGTVEKRNVTVGAPYGKSDIIISNGLSSGEMVVSAGVTTLQNNQKVRVI